MGQFDFPSAAALGRLKSESLSSSPADKLATAIAGIGSRILELAGFNGAATLNDLLQNLKSLAANKDEENLIYFAEAVVDDLRRLYSQSADMKRLVEEQIKSREFNQAVANATLHITRTNVQVRLQRVALLIVNGVKARDLEPENLDDMMRAAVELTEFDLQVLQKIYDAQSGLARSHKLQSSEWAQQVAFGWAGNFGFLDTEAWKGARSSLARLQSFGFIQHVTTNVTATGDLRTQPFGLLLEGARFFERVR
jgi:hypothetical protein